MGNSLSGISKETLDKFVQESDAPPWHRFAILNRKWRRHACAPCRWLVRVLPQGASIFEPGCGSGANLLWFGQKGYYKLYGSDIDEKAIELGNKLSSSLNVFLDLWKDDGLAPNKIPRDLDAILSVNWLYHIPGASFSAFLDTYGPFVKVGGFIAFDMVTRAYDYTPGNEFHSDDQKLPMEKRRPSEYRIRLDKEELAAIGIRHGFALVHSTCFLLTKPQRAAYLFRKVE